MADRPRILVLRDATRTSVGAGPLNHENCDVVLVETLAEGLDLLRQEHFDGFYVDTANVAVRERAANLIQAERILKTVPDGVALVDPELTVIWANAAFETWCGASPVGRKYYEAIGSPEILGPDYNPFHTALGGKATVTRLHCSDSRYLELAITPVPDPDGCVRQLISLTRDITAEVIQQQKLNALHQAGRELAPLAPDQLAELSAEERIELLKLNILRLTHDLLHYHVIEIRLLDRRTGRLEPLLQEGMSEAAARRVLYARPEGNGITGLVAATGRSYLVSDTSADSHYLVGAEGARSSLTVPLLDDDQVIGTFNVESPDLGALTEDDQQFLELFGREIAGALHTLELLSAEKHSAASRSVEAISRAVALPVDEILTTTTALLDRYIGHDATMTDKLKQILAGARAMKECIQKVGEDLAPGAVPAGSEDGAHPKLRGLRVLVADHDERVRRSAHAILGRFGCVVETAGDGQEALTMARLSTYDVVLVDIRLPDVSGYDMFRRLRQMQPGTRVVLMTAFGYDPSHAIVRARQEGLRDVLYKPFRVDQLLEVLEASKQAPPAAPESRPA